jgi:hypothetical protein
MVAGSGDELFSSSDNVAHYLSLQQTAHLLGGIRIPTRGARSEMLFHIEAFRVQLAKGRGALCPRRLIEALCRRPRSREVDGSPCRVQCSPFRLLTLGT